MARRLQRMMFAAAALCAAFGLNGCASGDFELDPAYWFPDGKKKLPGERREVFPGGVPGVTQGVPPELVRGNQAAQQAEEQAVAAPVQEAPQAEERPRPRPKKVARPRPAPAPEQDAQPAPPPPPQAAPRPAQSPGAWPSPQAQQQQPQPAPAGAWPAPPASGTFTR
jgi:hypothetical protein